MIDQVEVFSTLAMATLSRLGQAPTNSAEPLHHGLGAGNVTLTKATLGARRALQAAQLERRSAQAFDG
jgi:hypothetical protein